MNNPRGTGSTRVQAAADPEVVEVVLDALERLYDEVADVDPEDRLHFSLAVSEIVTNVVEHGAHRIAVGEAPEAPRPGIDIDVCVEITTDALRATVTDTAEASEMPLAQATMPDEWEESGRGLALALQVLDELRHDASPSNTWHLSRWRRP
ncbi:ATP-binding protein [Bogoriella caseilytica]|uniref:Serine/threonine-protein kinase RsbW n=1 Tax=Bogoriella caseilytica TaxID=56055 RepID=A0A3N2BDU0_9MICO|nr:ATP-binding protein [Bogoriella caseilytica]ROR73418.1 serine/threonine-protein kinase RsbW [Bogoriella caseilytica]